MSVLKLTFTCDAQIALEKIRQSSLFSDKQLVQIKIEKISNDGVEG